MRASFRWLAQNLSTLLLALILALVVWITAVVQADPNEEHTLSGMPVQVVGQDAGLMIVNEIPQEANLAVQAPRSIWNRLEKTPELAQAWIDLSGLQAGEHLVPVKTKVDISPVRLVGKDPAEILVELEPVVSNSFAVDLTVSGDPPLGYRKDEAQIEPAQVQVTGPKSQVEKVSNVQARLDIGGASETVSTSLPVQAVDEQGSMVPGVTLSPKTIRVTQPINLLGGFKNVVVKVVTAGKIANGYRLTNISVTPPNVTVFSSNPRFINELPGYVDTLPVDLEGLQEDTEFSVALDLPPEVSMVGEQSVLVQISIAPIEGSLTISLPVETVGLSPDLQAIMSPALVDVIVTGPLPILDTLRPSSFRAVVDVSGLGIGNYQLQPVVDLVPDQVQIQSILPETVDVSISLFPTPTPTRTVAPGSAPARLTTTPTPRP
jgi:YbbR domain-containing protein